MIAIVHDTIFGDKLDETLAALLAGEYRLRERNPTDAATEDRIRTTLEPRTLLRSDFGLQLPLIDLSDHLPDVDEATAIAHAVDCLEARRVDIAARDRMDEALTTIMHACVGAVPHPENSALDMATATPWRGFTAAWWADDVGPRDGTTFFEPTVPVDDLIPRCVILDHYVDADAHGHLGMCAIRSTVHVTRLDADPVETLRRLVDLKDRPLAEMAAEPADVEAIVIPIDPAARA